MPHVQTQRRRAFVQIGEFFQGGYYAGSIAYNGNTYAIVVGPKAGGEITSALASGNAQVGAGSLDDSVANTVALSAYSAGGARTINNLTLLGFTDWQVPSKSVMDIISTNLNPALSTIPAIFKTGGAEVLSNALHWTSTTYNWLRDDSYYDSGSPIYGWSPYYENGYATAPDSEPPPEPACPGSINPSDVYIVGRHDGEQFWNDVTWLCDGEVWEVVGYGPPQYHEVFTPQYQAYRKNPVTGVLDYVNKTSSSLIRAVRLVPM